MWILNPWGFIKAWSRLAEHARGSEPDKKCKTVFSSHVVLGPPEAHRKAELWPSPISTEPDSLRLGPGALHLIKPRVIPPHILTSTVAPLPQDWCDLWCVDLYVALCYPLVCVLMSLPVTPKTAPLAFQPPCSALSYFHCVDTNWMHANLRYTIRIGIIFAK